MTRRHEFPPNPSVKPIVIFFGPHHEGRAAFADETATKLVDAVSAATAIALATKVARDFKRIKFFSFRSCAAKIDALSAFLRRSKPRLDRLQFLVSFFQWEIR